MSLVVSLHKSSCICHNPLTWIHQQIRHFFRSSTVKIWYFLKPPQAFGFVSPPENWFRNYYLAFETTTRQHLLTVLLLLGILSCLLNKVCISDFISQWAKLDVLITWWCVGTLGLPDWALDTRKKALVPLCSE